MQRNSYFKELRRVGKMTVGGKRGGENPQPHFYSYFSLLPTYLNRPKDLKINA
jgi:hypothetical protein